MSRSLDLFRSWGSPFRELARLQSDMERMMQENFAAGKNLDFAPTCELEESKENYVMRFEIPGVKKEDVKIDLEGNQITVSAERKEEKTSNDKKKHYSEFRYGSYSRSFTFPTPIDESRVDARFENGVLSIVVPKASAATAKQIKIQ